jgi:hypothetical protein
MPTRRPSDCVALVHMSGRRPKRPDAGRTAPGLGCSDGRCPFVSLVSGRQRSILQTNDCSWRIVSAGWRPRGIFSRGRRPGDERFSHQPGRNRSSFGIKAPNQPSMSASLELNVQEDAARTISEFEMRKSPARDSSRALSSTAFSIGETRQCTAEPYFPPYATERVAIAYISLLFAYPFVRPESEQNSSHSTD